MPTPYPVVRLRPKSDARRIRHGFPWVYDNELVTDRRTKALPAGQIAVLEDSNRVPQALVALNPASKIIGRVLDRNIDQQIDGAWLKTRVSQALRLREQLYTTPFYRLIHAEADGLPGVVIDRFGDACVIQPNAAWADRMFDDLAEAVIAATGVGTVIKNASSRVRGLEGLDNDTLVARGGADAPIPVEMNGATYFADLLGGQKTGLFFDQRPNHAFAQGLISEGAHVLDVFCHVGGFGLASLAAGAGAVTMVDSSAPALALAEQGAKATGAAARLDTRKGDAFDVLTSLAEEGRKFDVVICDPPAFAPSKPALTKGLRAYERVARLAAGLVEPGGYLGLCSCSNAADIQQFRAASSRGIGRAGRQAQLIHTGFAGPDHPIHPQLPESGYLKALFYRLVD